MNGDAVSAVTGLLLLVILVVFGFYIWAQSNWKPHRTEGKLTEPPFEPKPPEPPPAPPSPERVKSDATGQKFLEGVGAVIGAIIGIPLMIAVAGGMVYGAWLLLAWIVAQFLNAVQAAR